MSWEPVIPSSRRLEGASITVSSTLEGVTFNFSPAFTDERNPKWTKGTEIAVDEGIGEDAGTVRLEATTDRHSPHRLGFSNGKSSRLRLVVKLKQTPQGTRRAEPVKYRPEGNAVIVRLPWAGENISRIATVIRDDKPLQKPTLSQLKAGR
jgi:hypothetical protein